LTGGIDAGGNAGTGAAPAPAEVPLANNTYSTFVWKVNGVTCCTKKVRVKYVCEADNKKISPASVRHCGADFLWKRRKVLVILERQFGSSNRLTISQ
jgi:hypothetical protein